MKKKRFIEKSLVLIKPDAVYRGISGQIINRFEKTGLKIVGIKIVNATKEQLDKHFPIHDDSWLQGIGGKTLENYEIHGIDPMEELGASDPLEIGKIILCWNYEYLMSGPVIAIVLEGVRAISVVRKIIGHTLPAKAQPGTIRGDFSINSSDYSSAEKCSCKNVVHASSNPEEANVECMVWFNPEELIDYSRSDEEVMFNKLQSSERRITMQIDNIEQEFGKMKTEDPRKAAELAYVIAKAAKDSGDTEKATKFGKESIAIFDKLNVQTQEECAAKHVTVNGIALPDLIHSDVVHDRLKPIEV